MYIYIYIYTYNRNRLRAHRGREGRDAAARRRLRGDRNVYHNTTNNTTNNNDSNTNDNKPTIDNDTVYYNTRSYYTVCKVRPYDTAQRQTIQCAIYCDLT